MLNIAAPCSLLTPLSFRHLLLPHDRSALYNLINDNIRLIKSILRPQPPPINLQIKNIKTLIIPHNIMELFRLHAGFEVEIRICDAFFSLDHVAYLRACGVDEEACALG